MLLLAMAALAGGPVMQLADEALAVEVGAGRATFVPDFMWSGQSSMYSGNGDPEDWRGVSVEVSSAGRRSRVGIEDCDAFYRAIRASGRAVTWGGTTDTVTVDFGRLRSGDRVLVDEVVGCRRVAHDQGGDDSRVEVLSLVGPLLSYRTTWSGFGAGGPPYHNESWGLLDLRTDAEASSGPLPLSRLVDEGQLMVALRADKYLRRARPDLTDTPGAFTDLESFAREVEVEGYMFHAWDRASDRVAIRLGVRTTPTFGLGPNQVEQLGVWVQPRAELREWLDEADTFLGSTEGVVGRDLRFPVP